MSYNVIGLALVATLSLVVGYAIAHRRHNPFPPYLVLLAVLLRIVGSTVRFDMIRLYYGGLADAQRYYMIGREIAQRFWSFDPLVFSFRFWFGVDRWWGTAFMEKLSAVVVTCIGPSMRGAYLVFSMMAFVGLYLIALAVYRNRPGRGSVLFATWIWFWPSLWFWPSSIGKESVTVLAIGLVTFGYCGGKQRIRWLPLGLGLALAFALRPHVGAVLGLALAAAYWFRSWRRPTRLRFVESVLAVALAVLMIYGMVSQFDLETADLEGVQEFVRYRTVQTMEGGSTIERTGLGLAALPMAFVNIWMRPLPWDVHNLMALFSALEILLLWTLTAFRYRAVGLTLKSWRRDRLLAFALPFLGGYTLMIGLTFANLGIIARQRTPLFPFVFMLLTAAGAYGTVRAVRRQARHRRPPPAEPATAPAGSRRGTGR